MVLVLKQTLTNNTSPVFPKMEKDKRQKTKGKQMLAA